METSDVLAIVQIIISVVACCLAVYIPEKIKWEQRYSQLLSDYRGYDVAAAVQGLVQFFVKDCKCDVGNIAKEYERHFDKEVENPKEDVRIDNDKNLHYQRRLLNAYFYELNECAKRRFLIGKKRVGRDFTKNEASVIKILYFMNVAAADSEMIFKDISTDERIPKFPRLSGMTKSIVQVYEILRNSKKYMDV